MLRRELLSCMRNFYDFVQHSYKQKQRLWRSAAREAAWVAKLLTICHANLRRPWSDQGASDASLSGVAVCTREAQVTEVAGIARQKESWRFKARDFVAPREKALGDRLEQINPFSDIASVKPIGCLPVDTFAINIDFAEIPATFMLPEEWATNFATRMMIEEPITVLEARGVVAAFRHKSRALRNFGKRHLHLNDNLANVLCAEKGRSGSFAMLVACRRLCALAIATNSAFYHRWVPSERNPADHASRRWEPLRVFQKEKVSSWRARAGQSGMQFPQGKPQGADHGKHLERQQGYNTQESTSRLQGREVCEEAGAAHKCFPTSFSWSDISGASGSVPRGCPGLPEADVQVHEFCQKGEAVNKTRSWTSP